MGKGKIEKVMHEYKEGSLHSGSKKGPKVSSRSQAIAIALNEAGKSKNSKHRMIHAARNMDSLRRKKPHEREY